MQARLNTLGSGLFGTDNSLRRTSAYGTRGEAIYAKYVI
jgi:hypothetical protein